MPITFDPDKDAANIANHGLSFLDFDGFDDEPTVVIDDRHDYGEIRKRAFGRIDGAAHCLVYVDGDLGARLISFRRAHEKEMRRYGL